VELPEPYTPDWNAAFAIYGAALLVILLGVLPNALHWLGLPSLF
jgi:hypothetical protein